MLNPEIETLIARLQDNLLLLYPSVEWMVSHEQPRTSLEPLVKISARRHRFEGDEPRVQRTFRLWDSINPASGKVMPNVWAFWAHETLAELQCVEP